MKISMGCNLCPNMCRIDRRHNIGKCLCNDEISISKYDIFKFEEPCISGKKGSGNIFFSNCNLKCIYCQNYEINTKINSGKKITIEELSDIMLDLQIKGCLNINLVTPTIYIDKIIKAIKIAKKKGLKLPIIYNCSGYENEEIIDEISEFIDIFMPDFKYIDNNLGYELSGVKNYFDVVKKAIDKMIENKGSVYFENGILEKGVLIRHLVLPNNIENSKKVLKYIKENYKDYVIVSLLMQYFPSNLACDEKYLKYGLDRTLNIDEYNEILDYFNQLNFKFGYYQELESNSSNYVPIWDFI